MNLGDIQWRDFISQYFIQMVRFAEDWTTKRIGDVRETWTARLNQLNVQYQQAAAASGTQLATQINTERQEVLKVLDGITQWEDRFEDTIKFDEEIFQRE
ncbi:hypothetical protein ACJZ2D_017126 [Fusarium nematophilum]